MQYKKGTNYMQFFIDHLANQLFHDLEWRMDNSQSHEECMIWSNRLNELESLLGKMSRGGEV